MNKYVDAITKHQVEETEKTRRLCIDTFGNSSLYNTTEPIFDNSSQNWICPAYWDNVACWPNTPANTEAVLSCPSYIAGFDRLNNATRKCTENGTWFIHKEFHTYWSNYTQCYRSKSSIVVLDMPSTNATKLIEYYFPIVKTISRTGYAVSFCTLIVAFIIMLSIKKLHCPRNKLHMHLFTSFMLRAFISLLKDVTFIEGVGLASDFTYQNGSSYFYINTESNNWGCKLVTTLWEYFITANYSWILMEGLYLHNLIFRALFADTDRNILRYILLGWGLPLFVIGPWVATRILTEDTYCWTTHDNLKTLFIIKIPIMISILINLILFIKISIVLFTKLHSPVNYEQTKRYQKWAKSTLVLVPLFGIHYSILIAMSFTIQNQVVEVIWLFFDQLFASFQGFVVAILYCFLNGEVKAELKPILHSFLMYWASTSCCKPCFPCRDKYLSSARGRTSVCTTMSCSSLFNNGIHQRNSRTKWDMFPRPKHSVTTGVHSWQDISRCNGKPIRNNSNELYHLNAPYKFSSNGSMPGVEPNMYLELNKERCQSEPDLIEERIIMLPKQ